MPNATNPKQFDKSGTFLQERVEYNRQIKMLSTSNQVGRLFPKKSEC